MIRSHSAAPKFWSLTRALLVMMVATTSHVHAQSLAQRVGNITDGRVQFHFPSRDGSCGDGRTYMRVSTGNGGDIYGNWSSDAMMPACARGPVRVLSAIRHCLNKARVHR